MLPETIPPTPTFGGAPGTSWPQENWKEFCAWAERWGLETSMAIKVARFAEAFGTPVDIISGFRTDEEQQALKDSGETNLGPSQSNHCSCPSTAVDIWPHIAVTDVVKASVGPAARVAGLRWGGGSPVDSRGIPSDWNHLDQGPRVK